MRTSIILSLTASIALVSGLPAWADPPAKAEGRLKLTVVTTSAHCDWSWGHSRAWHEDRYAEIIRNVLVLMRQYPSYVWQLENENEELAPFLKKAAREWPGMVEEFWQRVREGRIEVIVAISNPRLTEVYPETIVRNLVLGKEYFRRHAPGIEQKVFNAVDLMCGSSQTPQILAQAGYRYFMFSRPSDKKVAFWRTGLDGTRMLNVCQHYGYEGPEVKGVRLQSLSGDDILPDVALAKAAETWDRRTKVLATSARYLEELDRRGGPDLELSGVLDSLECLCEGSVHGNRNLYTMNNQNEDLLLSVEKAQVMASLAGRVFPKSAMDALWHDLLSCTGHAILYCWTPDYEERLAKARQTRADGQRALRDALAAVAAGIRTPKEAGRRVVVFNFHAWPTSGLVEFILPADRLSLHDSAGTTVPLQLLDAHDGAHRVAFVAQGVPACGYKTYCLRPSDHGGIAPSPARRGLGPVETDHYRARLLPDGRVEIFDKDRGAVLGSPDVGGLGDVVFYDAPMPNDWEINGPLGERHVWSPEAQRFECVEGPAFVSLSASGTIGLHRVRREVRFTRGSRRIDYLIDVDAADGCGVFCVRFPTGLAGRVVAGIPFGVEPRDAAAFAKEPFRGEYFVKGYPDGYHATRWTDLSSEEFGYTVICPPGLPTGYFYKASDQALEIMLLRVRPMPQGGFAQVHPSIQGKGHHTWRCALVPHRGAWRESAPYRHALESHAALAAFLPDAAVGVSGPPRNAAATALIASSDTGSLIEVEPAGVVLSAMRLLDTRPGQRPEWELRLYETTGQSAEVTIRLARAANRVRETNFLGECTRQTGPIRTAGREIRFPIQPWRIVTLRGCWAQ